VKEALALVLEDRDFYGQDGGVTLSGGEPPLQPEFCFELLSGLKREGINTALDTCGCVKWDILEKMLPVTDLFLYDFKQADSSAHRRLTGQGNELILANLRRLSEVGARIEIRMPLIPELNDAANDLRAAGKILETLRLERVKILPYYALARSKYAAMGIADTMPEVETPDDAVLARAGGILRECGVFAVSGKE